MRARGKSLSKDRALLLLLAFSVGAALMYVLDPQRGRRRRALVRDRVMHGGHLIEDAGKRVRGVSRDLRNRARGATAELRSRFSGNGVDDATLDARVRTQLGRRIEDLEALNVSVYNGKVTLRGSLGTRDAKRAVSAARRVRGVSEVENLIQTD